MYRSLVGDLHLNTTILLPLIPTYMSTVLSLRYHPLICPTIFSSLVLPFLLPSFLRSAPLFASHAHSPYARIFQRGSHCIVKSLSANNNFLIKLDRVSCTNYFMSINNPRYSIKLIKIATRNKKSKILALQTTLCAS